MTLPHPENGPAIPNPDDLREQAWSRYVNRPHADIRAGWSEYLAELERIGG